MDLQGFEIIEKIGGGSAATVWKARQTSLDRVVAIKEINAESVGSAAHADAVVASVRAAAALRDPGVTEVFDVIGRGDRHWVVMEYIQGATLGAIVASKGTLSPRDALKVALAVAQTLEVAWSQARLIHGNLSSSNIMIDAHGVVKVTDLGFGVCPPPADAAGRPTPPSHLAAPHFKAPEQALGRPCAHPRTDMYALGAVLYHMVTGLRPFDAPTEAEVLRRHVESYLPNPRDINPAVGLPVVRMITRLMMKDPAHRPQTWGEVIEDLTKLAAGRVLVRRRLPRAMSSIDRREGQPPPVAPVDAPAAPAHGRPGVPLWFRAAAWLALLAGWGWLAWRQMTDPVLVTVWQPPLPVPRAFVRPTPQPAPAAPDKTSPPPADTRTPSPSPPAAAAAETSTAEEEALLAQARHAVAGHLLAGRFDAALAATAVGSASSSRPFRNALADLGEFARQVARVNGSVADVFRARVGTEIAVVFDGTSRRIVPQAVAGENVSALLLRPGGGEPARVSFSVAELSDAERLRLLGTPGTPHARAMHLLLRLRMGDTAGARQLASGCGPLSEEFARALDAPR